MKKMIIIIIFNSYSDIVLHPMRGLPHPLILVTFARKTHILSFSNILDFLDLFQNFFMSFSNRTATRYVAFQRQATMLVATANFILDANCYKCRVNHLLNIERLQLLNPLMVGISPNWVLILILI